VRQLHSPPDSVSENSGHSLPSRWRPGCARGDLVALRWASVNLKDGWLRVSMGKTKEEALVPMSRLCSEALEECKARDVVSPEFVFVDDEGRRTPEVRVLRALATAKKLVGITRRFGFHDLRHTFASTLASQGVSIQVIAKALGHTSTRMAERYARPSEEAIRRAAEALDRANESLAVNSPRELRSANTTGGAAERGSMSRATKEMHGGRYRDRTDDLLRVKQTLCR
jgi:Phage integrase family